MKFNPDTVAKLVSQRAKHGSAPGFSGWTESLLLPLLTDPELLAALTTLLEDIGAGRLYARSRNLLCTSLLLAVRKPSGGVRPIAVGELFIKLSALYLLRLLPDHTLSNLFHPIQFGVGVKGGVELAVHTLQSHLEHHPENVVLKIDFKNGFNSLHVAGKQ